MDIPHDRRAEDANPFGYAYIMQSLIRSVEKLSDRVDVSATKAELGVAFAKLDEKADKDTTTLTLNRIEKTLETHKVETDKRLAAIERNQAPPWMLPALAVIIAACAIIVPHFWK